MGEVTYFVIKIYLLDKIVHVEDSPGVPLFVFLYLFLLFEIGVTVRWVQALSHCSEVQGLTFSCDACANSLSGWSGRTTSARRSRGTSTSCRAKRACERPTSQYSSVSAGYTGKAVVSVPTCPRHSQ